MHSCICAAHKSHWQNIIPKIRLPSRRGCVARARHSRKGRYMSPLVKSAVLSLGLLAGTAVAAYAQSESIAALPPDAAATPAPQGAVVAPSPSYVGPDPGITWSAQEKQTQPVSALPEICRSRSRGDVGRAGASDPAGSAVAGVCRPAADHGRPRRLRLDPDQGQAAHSRSLPFVQSIASAGRNSFVPPDACFEPIARVCALRASPS